MILLLVFLDNMEVVQTSMTFKNGTLVSNNKFQKEVRSLSQEKYRHEGL